MQAQIIPFPTPKTRDQMRVQQITIDGEFYEDDLSNLLLMSDEDPEQLAQELSTYVHMADGWND